MDVPFDAMRVIKGDTPIGDFRSTFQDDRDRVLYSSAFRRLAGVTQVAAVREHHLLHNRMTHSLKVAQLGRRMAQQLIFENSKVKNSKSDLEDEEWLPDIVEAAGLAHDIGHPPFGHIAEEVLKQEMTSIRNTGNGESTFEGNAQSFRVVTKLASYKKDWNGLNLARATLNAILKYPKYERQVSGPPPLWSDRSHGAKWGVYQSERREFEHARQQRLSSAPNGNRDRTLRSAGAVIMDWADDVSYAIHDLADYFRAGLIPLDVIHLEGTSKKAERRKAFLEFTEQELGGQDNQFDPDQLAEQYDYLVRRKISVNCEWTDTRHDRFELNQLMRELHEDFCAGVSATSTPPYVEVALDVQYQVEILKKFTWFYVIRQPSLAVAQKGQQRIIRDLFRDLVQILDDYEPGSRATSRIPVHLRDIYETGMKFELGDDSTNDEYRRGRAVCDYICALTEDQTIDLYERLTGHAVSRGSIFGAWFG
ncbi:deoxyguanosinetriphosphate triphosphohydrolase family protein [Streptomyces sp. NPDC005149]